MFLSRFDRSGRLNLYVGSLQAPLWLGARISVSEGMLWLFSNARRAGAIFFEFGGVGIIVSLSDLVALSPVFYLVLLQVSISPYTSVALAPSAATPKTTCEYCSIYVQVKEPIVSDFFPFGLAFSLSLTVSPNCIHSVSSFSTGPVNSAEATIFRLQPQDTQACLWEGNWIVCMRNNIKKTSFFLNDRPINFSLHFFSM